MLGVQRFSASIKSDTVLIHPTLERRMNRISEAKHLGRGARGQKGNQQELHFL
jgi:hypothetical protein